MKKGAIIALLILTILTTVGCGKSSADKLKPLVGLSWYESYEDVKAALKYTLTKERNSENGKEKIVDYTGAELFETECDLTLCFSESGLIGLNYHDIKQTNNYQTWFSYIENRYGYPTEESSGMASWYDDPLGKNTSVYLFNLEEGVQISFYTSSSSPDKSYSGGKKERKEPNIIYVPEPELRTPVVPVEPEIVERTQPVTTAPVQTEIVTDAQGDVVEVIELPPEPDEITDENNGEEPEDNESESENSPTVTTRAPLLGDVARHTKTTANSGSVTTTTTRKNTAVTSSLLTTTSRTTTVTTTTTHDYKSDYKVNGITFYGSADTQRRRMNGYNQLYEYKVNEPGQPWELIMEYENVPYLDKSCDGVLCFTSLGLVGINYFDNNASDYDYWLRKLKTIYGAPSETQSDYTAWYDNPIGNGTMIYVLALDDGIQISFFADDTGSEISK